MVRRFTTFKAAEYPMITFNENWLGSLIFRSVLSLFWVVVGVNVCIIGNLQMFFWFLITSKTTTKLDYYIKDEIF
jgi:hypothetical protein